MEKFTLPSQQQIVLTAFGLTAFRPIAFTAGQQLFGGKQNGNSEKFPDQVIEEPDYFTTSYLGTKVWSNLVIPAGVWFDIDNNPIPYGQPDGSDFIVDCVLCEVTRHKVYKQTFVTGRSESFIEHISNGSYSVSIKGCLFSPYDDVSPRGQRNVLISIDSANCSIPIRSDFLADFNISQLYINRIFAPQTQGTMNIQAFEISAISDSPYELIINE